MSRAKVSSTPVATLLVIGLAFPATAWSADPRFSLAVGAEYTTGDYGGDQSVEETYVPVTAVLDVERVSFRLTVPYLSVRAPELTYFDGPDGQPIVGEGPVVTNDGIGDVQAVVTVYNVLSAGDGSSALDLTGKIKFGTADVDAGLGTGEQDYSVQADMFRFFSRFTAMGTLGYSLRGDPEGYDLDDTFYASLGGSYAVTNRVQLGGFFDFREASIQGTDDIQELSGWVATQVGDRGRVDFYVLTGFSDSSPDWGAGISYRASF
jgi:hypothetical protein